MSSQDPQRPEPPACPRTPWWGLVRRAVIGSAAVVGVYLGGFLWAEVSPAAYSVVFLVLASTPLLLKFSFWKKLILLLPLLIFRVAGKILIKVFGLKAMGQLFRRYGLLEERFNRLMAGFKETQNGLLARWNSLTRRTQAHLILTFLPFLGLLVIGVVVVKLLRFKLLQIVVEKVMQKSVLGASERIKKKKNEKLNQSITDESGSQNEPKSP